MFRLKRRATPTVSSQPYGISLDSSVRLLGAHSSSKNLSYQCRIWVGSCLPWKIPQRPFWVKFTAHPRQYRSRDYEQEYFSDGITDSIKYGDTLVKLAANHFYQQHYLKAEALFLRAASIYEAKFIPLAHANVLQWLGEIARVKGLEDMAEELDTKAKELLRSNE